LRRQLLFFLLPVALGASQKVPSPVPPPPHSRTERGKGCHSLVYLGLQLLPFLIASLLSPSDVPWSGHCQALAPEYARAAMLLKKESLARLAKVDCSQEQALRAEFGITGYPVLKLFRDGNRTHPMDFPGEQEAASIVEWLKRKARPSLVLLEEIDEVAAFVNLHNVAVVGFFQDLHDPDVGLFGDVASDTPEVAFAITDNLLLFQHYNITEDTISLFRKDDGQRVDFLADTELGLDEKDLAQFISVQSLDLVMEFTNKVRPQVLFVLVDVSGEGASVLQYFGLKGHDAPALRFINIEANKKYRLATHGLTAHGIHTFCQEVLQGKIQEIPNDWEEKPVKVVVGKNFEQVAFDETKNVFVKFYAPWCPHSKALAPVWEELGEKYKDHNNIVIAEMDATANEVADLTIRGYPTLYFFPTGPGQRREGREETVLGFALTEGLLPEPSLQPQLPKSVLQRNSAVPTCTVAAVGEQSIPGSSKGCLCFSRLLRPPKSHGRSYKSCWPPPKPHFLQEVPTAS
uniref:protein disulfide-isomerase n=1 Tax=Pseudonaja textilis TaxID=8673 RepID=A0A670ZEM0_PSETE